MIRSCLLSDQLSWVIALRSVSVIMAMSLVLVFSPLRLMAATTPSLPQPTLVVVIVVDQLRADLLQRQYQHGFARLMGEGRVYEKAQLGHAVSTTCPGHAVVLTGFHPSKIGIPSNSFIDEQSGELLYCVFDDDPGTLEIGGDEQRSPRIMRVSTLGDWMKTSDPNSKVFSLSGKDRAAITLGGQHADAAYWFNRKTGRFISSGYYMTELPDYVSKFNGSDPVADGYMKDFPERWQHGPGSQREDDFPGEDDELGISSGHPVTLGETRSIAAQVFQSPYIDKATLGLALEVFREEQLGRGDSIDLLAISLSAADTIGHLYGPNSAEAEDNLNRLDTLLGTLLDELDQALGKQGYIVAFTADHGVADLPEWKKRQGNLQCSKNDGRIELLPLAFQLYWKIYWEFTFPFGDPRPMVSFSGAGLSISRDSVRQHNQTFENVRAYIESLLEANDFVANAWTKTEIEHNAGPEAELMRHSYVAGRSADLIVQFHEGCMLPGAGTTHGSLYHYDRHIPLVFYGWKVKPALLQQPAMSVDIGPTLANHIGIEVPQVLDGSVLLLAEPVGPEADSR